MISWLVFALIIVSLLAFDLGVLHKRDEVLSLKHSALLTIFYILIACIFGIYVYYAKGSNSSEEYFTGFLLEKTMSMDNIFLLSMIFKFFNIPAKYQHRVLFWGILGVIILRAIMIYLGASLLEHFSWILFIFAAILIYTGIKTLSVSLNHKIDIKEMYVYKFFSRHFNLYPKIVGNKFILCENNKIYITPLFMALIMIETIDLIFAVDSIPAIFAVTQDIYIVYTSNIFAILGLRAMYFCLSDIIARFKYIKYSLALILILIGIKILAMHFIKIPAYITLIVTMLLLIGGIIASLILNKKEHK